MEANKPAIVPARAAVLCNFDGKAPGAERGDGGIDAYQHRRLGVVRPEPRASRQDQVTYDDGDGRAEKTGKLAFRPRRR